MISILFDCIVEFNFNLVLVIVFNLLIANSLNLNQSKSTYYQ